ncbi:MAG: Ig-like domain-containing protein [Candidatus Poribacteria bacterium]|nr:Ig-like domain-containing protein [Candidatus Poribacteria bacterium]
MTYGISPNDGGLSFLGTSTGTTSDNGRSAKTLVLGSDASGSYTVTASVGSVSVSRTATVDTPPPPPDGPITRTMYRVESIPFHPGDTVTFIASVRQVRDGANRGVSGETITFSLSPDNGTASLSTTSGTTDSNGSVRTTLTLSSSASGSYSVTATFGDGTTKTHGTGTVYNPNKPRGFSIAMRSTFASIEPGEIKTFTAEVQKDGNWISGQTVTFSVSPDDGTVSLSTASGTTNSNGRASTTLVTGSGSSGTYTVTATLDNSQSISSTATVETSTPTETPSRTIVLSINDLGPQNPGDSVTFTALVREGGNRLSGQTVTFSVSPDDETTSLSTASAATDSNGNASTTLTLGSSASAGTYSVTATLDDGQSASNSTWIARPPPPPPPPPELSIVVVHSPGSGDPGDWLTFIVEVQEDGNPASGKTVTFSITSGDGNLSFLGGTSTGTTGENGRVAKTLVLGNDASGSYTVTASVGTVSVSVTATVDTPPVPPDGPITRTMYRVESIPFHPGDTVTFIASVRQVRDGANRGVSGETITFSLSPDNGTASLSTTSGTTDSNGSVRTTLTLSSSASGSYSVTATFGDGTTKTHGTGTVYNPNKPRGFIIAMRSTSGSIEPGEIKTFTAEVQKDRNWISGQTVTFSVSPDDGTVSLTTTSGTTNSNGRASTTLITGSGSSGTYRVTATLDNGQSISSTATVETSTPTETPLRTIVLSISNLGPINPGDSVTFTALVREGGNRVSGQTVTFSVSPDDETTSLSTVSAATDSNGNASTTLTLGSSASAGTYTVTAMLDDGQSASNSTWIARPPPPPPPPRTLVMFSDNLGFSQPGDSVTFTAEVGESGSPLQGQTVTFNVSPDNGTASLNPTSATTDSDGRTQTTLTLGSDASGSYTITASFNLLSVSSTVTVGTATVETPTSQQQLDLAIGSHPTPRGTSVNVSVSQNGNPVADQAVRFSVTPDDGSALLSATSTITDSDGQASATLITGSNSAGSYTITATLNDGQSTSGAATVKTSSPSLPPPLMLEPTTLSIVSGDNQNGLTGETLSTPFVVEVRDQNGDPMEGVTVNFAVSTGGGLLSSETGITNANGQTDSVLTLGSDPGTNSVEVSVEGISQTVTFNAEASRPPPVPTVLSIVSGDNQEELTGEALTNPFVVEVRDQYDSPMEGVTVTFAVTAGGGSLSAATATTDADGRAESTLTLGSEPGTNSVEVNVEGISQTLVFNAEASLPPPVPTVLSIVSGDNQEELAGEALASPFVVEVRDQYDSPMEGVMVTFAVSAGGGSLSSAMKMTDANGRAESILTLGSNFGANTVEVSVEGITEAAIFNAVAKLLEFDLSVPSGISFIHVPLKVRLVDGVAGVIESVGDLYDALGGDAAVRYLITYNRDTRQWNSYLGDESRGDPEDRILTDELGIVANMQTSVSVRLGGEALGVDGMSTITLNRGTNLVGLPLKDPRITRVSDLFTLEGIAGVVSTITASDGRKFEAAGRASDDGDIPVTGGGAFLLIATEAATINISGEGWTNSPVMAAAPSIALTGVESGNATPVLALTGSISVDGTGMNRAGVHVTVSNLATGKSVSTSTANRDYQDVDYQITMVDMGTGQAARIGDVLEISAQSADSSIRFHPVRHIVAAEDVERGRIHLPELIAHEIPAKTELWVNYPNPFNPETWIPYGLAKDADVQISIYDLNGVLVRQLNLGHQTAGNYTERSRAAYWDGRNVIGERVASGVYFYTLTTDDFTSTRKMLIGK